MKGVFHCILYFCLRKVSTSIIFKKTIGKLIIFIIIHDSLFSIIGHFILVTNAHIQIVVWVVDIAINYFLSPFDQNTSINTGPILNVYCVVGNFNSCTWASLNVTTSHEVIWNATRDLGHLAGDVNQLQACLWKHGSQPSGKVLCWLSVEFSETRYRHRSV
jgi:hypothetical protein